jgi:hypothetical protein
MQLGFLGDDAAHAKLVSPCFDAILVNSVHVIPCYPGPN